MHNPFSRPAPIILRAVPSSDIDAKFLRESRAKDVLVTRKSREKMAIRNLGICHAPIRDS